MARVYDSKSGNAICTAWLAPNGYFVTAGHCTAGFYTFDELQFRVPPSSCDGYIKLPAAKDRFKVDLDSIRFNVDLENSEDWAIFRLRNDAALPELFRNGHFFRISNRTVSRSNPEEFLNVGFGVEMRSFDGCKSRYRTMLMGKGEGYSTDGYLIHFADTHMGNSGSPLFQKLNEILYAYGIHRGGGCPNVATKVLNPGFLEALSDAPGKGSLYVDARGPDSGESTGKINAPDRSLSRSLQRAKNGATINVAPGDYSEDKFSIPAKSLRIRAPFGGFSIKIAKEGIEKP